MNSKNQFREKARAIRKNLLEQFGKLQPDIKAPVDLKKNVFDTLDTIQLASEMKDVFSINLADTQKMSVGTRDQVTGELSDNTWPVEIPKPPAKV